MKQGVLQLRGILARFTGLMERLHAPKILPRGVVRHRYGRGGERMAERHLRRLGYRIVARNFRAAGGEIDLVAIEDGTIVFVEVKRRNGTGAGAPEESVDERKQERIRRAAQAFAERYKVAERATRFDVVAIRDEDRHHHLEHLKDAF